MASEDIENAVLGYLRETVAEYSHGKCGLSLVPKLTPDNTRSAASMHSGLIVSKTPLGKWIVPASPIVDENSDYTN
jgi:hypothetical protein